MFGLINIHSLRNKVDLALHTFDENHLSLLCITESRHSQDDLCIRRLQSLNLSIIHRARSASLTSINYGGLVCFALPTVSLVIHDTPIERTSFEIMYFSSTNLYDRYNFILVYRPGSTGPSNTFFDELYDLLLNIDAPDPIVLLGDFNIHLECPSSRNTARLFSIIVDLGFVYQPTAATHTLGGTIYGIFFAYLLASQTACHRA